MSFVSFTFLFFFVVFISLFHIAARFDKNAVKIQQVLIFFASVVFYAFADIKFVPFIAYAIFLSYFAGRLSGMEGRKGKIVFAAFVVADLLPLLFFKYAPSGWKGQLLFPLGLSFFTFQSLSYIIDCRTKKVEAEKNPFMVALFISFFPVVSLGPIQRPGNLIPQLKTAHRFNYENAADGLKIFAWGAFKKFCVADALAVYVNHVYAPSGLSAQPAPALLLAIVFYSFQLYCDFSGYSDMAIGVSKYMGFDVGKNFDHPFLAVSVGDFWRRWHISLSTWLRDYVYIPLGGSRVALYRIYANLIITFLVSGIWHGSTWNFVIWGLLHGLYQCAGRAAKPVTEKIKTPDFIKIAVTFCLVSISLIFFRAETLSDVGMVIQGIARLPQNIGQFIAIKGQLGFKEALRAAFSIEGGFVNMVDRLITLAVFICASVATRNKSGLEIIKSKPVAVRWLAYYALCLLIIYFFNTGLVTNFIYNNF